MYTGKSTKKTLKGWPIWASLPVGFLVRLSIEAEQNLGIVLKEAIWQLLPKPLVPKAQDMICE